MGAGGAIELISCVLALRDGIVPPTLNFETPDPDCDLDYVVEGARRVPLAVAMSNSFAFGGSNASLVLRAYAESKLGGG
jgi:3-oxoacyl-[acyl-carrier-protein] synthase II